MSTSALVTESGKNVMVLLKKLAVKIHTAIIVVTHDRRMVEDFVRVFEVSDGRIVSERRNGSGSSPW